MQIQSVNNYVTNNTFRAKFLRNDTLNRVLESSSEQELYKFSKHLQKITEMKDSMTYFYLKESIVSPKNNNNYNKLSINLNTKIDTILPVESSICVSQTEYQQFDEPSNYIYSTALKGINDFLEKFYQNRGKEKSLRDVTLEVINGHLSDDKIF